MLDTKELRGRIAKSGLSQRKLALLIGMTEKTFYGKMKSGVFKTDELEQVAELIGMNPKEIGVLFCKEVR